MRTGDRSISAEKVFAAINSTSLLAGLCAGVWWVGLVPTADSDPVVDRRSSSWLLVSPVMLGEIDFMSKQAGVGVAGVGDRGVLYVDNSCGASSRPDELTQTGVNDSLVGDRIFLVTFALAASLEASSANVGM